MKALTLLAAAIGLASARPQVLAPAAEPGAPTAASVVSGAAAAPGAPTVTLGAPGAEAVARARELAARGLPNPHAGGGARTIAAIPGLGFGIGVEGNPYGPKAYGMGLNNPWAIRPNPWQMEWALEVTKTFPNTLVRVDVDGEVAITDRYGKEIDFFEV